MNNEISVIEVKDFSDFIAKIESDHSVASFYRGQRKDWPILPEIARRTPNDGKRIIELEQTALKEFLQKGAPYFPFDPDNRSHIELLMVGRHYGLTTRLTDWTTNPIAALWFAIRNVSSERETEFAVVWEFFPKEIEDASRTGYLDHNLSAEGFPHTQHFTPIHIDKRIIAQQGVFIIHGNGLERFNPKFTPMQDEKKEQLRKIVVSRNIIGRLLKTLNQCGINHLTMFPDLEGLCRQINTGML